MTAFDAKTVKPGSMWLTRHGEKVEFVAYAPSAIEGHKAVFVDSSGEIQVLYSDGLWLGDGQHALDIIGPAPATVTLPECWLVRWMSRGVWCVDAFESEAKAKGFASVNGGHITHIPAREVPADEVQT